MGTTGGGIDSFFLSVDAVDGTNSIDLSGVADASMLASTTVAVSLGIRGISLTSAGLDVPTLDGFEIVGDACISFMIKACGFVGGAVGEK